MSACVVSELFYSKILSKLKECLNVRSSVNPSFFEPLWDYLFIVRLSEKITKAHALICTANGQIFRIILCIETEQKNYFEEYRKLSNSEAKRGANEKRKHFQVVLR